jgi:hypothetical protein
LRFGAVRFAVALTAALMLRRLRGFAPGVIAFWKAVALAASVPSVDPTDSATLISRASSLEGLSTWNSFLKLNRQASSRTTIFASPRPLKSTETILTPL